MKSNLIFKKSPDVGYRYLSSATSATLACPVISWTPTLVVLRPASSMPCCESCQLTYLLVGYPGRVLGSILVVQVGGRIHLPYSGQCRSQQVSQHGGTDVECILHLLGSTAGLCRYGVCGAMQVIFMNPGMSSLLVFHIGARSTSLTC
jgi:hypothetical protein